MKNHRLPGIAVVAEDADPVARAVEAKMRQLRRRVLYIPTSELASIPLQIVDDSLLLQREAISAVLFRARPDSHFGGNFVESDASFSSNEARATWLAALNLPSVCAINRADEELWFSNAEWPIWRRRLISEGIPVVSLSVGDIDSLNDRPVVWMPWGGVFAHPPGPYARRAFATALIPAEGIHVTLWCCGSPIDGPGDGFIRGAASVMSSHGIELASIVSDSTDRIVSCTAYPDVPESFVSPVAHRITEVLNADMRGRR